MTLRTPRLLTLATAAIVSAAIVFTAIAAARPMHAEPPTSPCALLSPLQIKTVLDTPVLAGKPGAPSDGTTDCTWPDSKGETRVYLSLKEPGIEYKSFRDSMMATGRLVPISGLSGDAFYIASAGNSAALYALRASTSCSSQSTASASPRPRTNPPSGPSPPQSSPNSKCPPPSTAHFDVMDKTNYTRPIYWSCVICEANKR